MGEYSFKSDVEPSEKQLNSLMTEVAQEAKQKADDADLRFFSQLRELAKNANNQKLSFKQI